MKNVSFFVSLTLSYVRVGYLLHLVTAILISLLFVIYRFTAMGHWLVEDFSLLRLVVLVPLLSTPLFPQLDARSRFQNYKQLKDQFYLYGFDPRIVKPFIKSRCQRDAAMVAAIELGLDKKCRQHFYDKGYRWFHLLPDYLFTNPRFLLSRAFWMTTFFARTYEPRVNFYDQQKPALLSPPL